MPSLKSFCLLHNYICNLQIPAMRKAASEGLSYLWMTSSDGADCSAPLKERVRSADCDFAALLTLQECCINKMFSNRYIIQ